MAVVSLSARSSSLRVWVADRGEEKVELALQRQRLGLHRGLDGREPGLQGGVLVGEDAPDQVKLPLHVVGEVVDGGGQPAGHLLQLEGLVADRGGEQVELALQRQRLGPHRGVDGREPGLQGGVLVGEDAPDQVKLPLHGQRLRLERRLEGDEPGLQGGVDRAEDVTDGLQLGLLVGAHPVDGVREFRDGLLVLEGAPLDGLHNLGEVVDH